VSDLLPHVVTIREGCYYRRQNGDVVGPMPKPGWWGNAERGGEVWDHANHIYWQGGKSCCSPSHDLVAEVFISSKPR